MDYPIRKDCILKIEKKFFELKWGRSPQSKSKSSPWIYLGSQILKVKVLRHSYGTIKHRHTFTLKVLKVYKQKKEKLPPVLDRLSVGDEFRMRGKNLYPAVIKHWPGKIAKSYILK